MTPWPPCHVCGNTTGPCDHMSAHLYPEDDMDTEDGLFATAIHANTLPSGVDAVLDALNTLWIDLRDQHADATHPANQDGIADTMNTIADAFDMIRAYREESAQ